MFALIRNQTIIFWIYNIYKVVVMWLYRAQWVVLGQAVWICHWSISPSPASPPSPSCWNICCRFFELQYSREKNSITNAYSTAYCCSLLTICPTCCPRHDPDDAPDMPQMMPQTCPRLSSHMPQILSQTCDLCDLSRSNQSQQSHQGVRSKLLLRTGVFSKSGFISIYPNRALWL